MSTILLHMAWP